MFHIDVEGNSEIKFARILADKMGVKLEVETLREKEFSKYINQVIEHYEYPLVHPNAFGIFLLSRLARENEIKVLLSGDGADELFGGYSFHIKYLRSLKLPSFVKKIVKKVYNFTSHEVLPTVYSKAIISSEERRKKIEEKYHFVPSSIERNMQAMLVSSLSEYLQPLNIRADKLGMANSVEFRSPFLDINVAKFAVNLPLRYKVNQRAGKVILKKLAERKIPKELVYRKKMGFSVPLIDIANVNKSCDTHQNYVLYSADVLSKMMQKI